MILFYILTSVIVLTWFMVVWHVAKGRTWSLDRRRFVFWAGIIVLLVVIRYLEH